VKSYKGHYATNTKEISFNELKEAKERVFMGLKRLSKVFLRKEEKFSMHVVCFSYK